MPAPLQETTPGMTFVVPFDGSELAEAALVRAVEFGTVLEERVVAVSVIPERDSTYARERGWIDPDEPFEMRAVVERLHEQVADLAPSADFRHEVVSRYASAGTIAGRVRGVARELDASMVFVGSENAGRVVTAVSSVGGSVAADRDYDVVIIRNRSPAKVEKIRQASPYRKSDFY